MKDVIRLIRLLTAAAVFAATVYALLAAPGFLFSEASTIRDRTTQAAGR